MGNTSKKDSKKNMVTGTENETEGMNMENTLKENILNGENVLKGDCKALETLLNTKTDGTGASVIVKIDSKRGTVAKDLSTLNDLIALDYYRGSNLFDIIKKGSVPCKVVNENAPDGEETEKVTVTITDGETKPTLSGLKKAGLIDQDVIDRVDILRRVAAYVKTGEEHYLTGWTDEKKDVPNKAVSHAIEEMKTAGTLSKNKARSIMSRVFRDLTGNRYKKEIFPKLYNEFESYILKRGKAWGTRTVVSKATAGDMALEFAWMYFNGRTEFKYIAE